MKNFAHSLVQKLAASRYSKTGKISIRAGFFTLSLGLLATGCPMSSTLQAAPLTWIGATAGTWGTATNWNPNQTPTTSDDLTIAGPGGTAGSALAIDVNSPSQAGTIAFTNTAATSLTDTASGANQILTLQSGLTTGTGAVTVGSTTANQNVTLTLGTSQTWNVGTGGMTTNGISGAGLILTKSGAGISTANAANTLAALTIDNGAVYINNVTNAATVNLGTADNPANNVEFRFISTTPTYASSIVVNAGAGTRTLTAQSAGAVFFNTSATATITLNKDLLVQRLSSGNAGFQINGVISGVGGIGLTATANAGNVVALAGANTYTGDTRIAGAQKLDLKNQLAAQNSTINLTGTTASNLIFDSTVTANAFTVGGLASTTAGAGKDIALVNSTYTSGTAPTQNATGIALTLGNNTTNASYAGVLSGGGSIVKAGSNIQTFTNANTYTGGTTVNGGTLLAGNATALGGGSVIINNAGTVNVLDTAVGTPAVGMLALAAGTTLTLNSGGTLTMTLANNGTSDSINFATSTGTLTLAGTLALNTVDSINYADSYTLFTNATSLTTTGLSITGYDTANYTASLSNTGVLSFTAVAVPEPSTWVAAGVGLLGILFVTKQRKAAYLCGSRKVD